MKQNLIAALLLSIAVSACGSRLVWQGPPGSTREDVANASIACRQQADDWITRYDQTYDGWDGMGDEQLPEGRGGTLYNEASGIFDRCMLARGYELVPQQ